MMPVFNLHLNIWNVFECMVTLKAVLVIRQLIITYLMPKPLIHHLTVLVRNKHAFLFSIAKVFSFYIANTILQMYF